MDDVINSATTRKNAKSGSKRALECGKREHNGTKARVPEKLGSPERPLWDSAPVPSSPRAPLRPPVRHLS